MFPQTRTWNSSNDLDGKVFHNKFVLLAFLSFFFLSLRWLYTEVIRKIKYAKSFFSFLHFLIKKIILDRKHELAPITLRCYMTFNPFKWLFHSGSHEKLRKNIFSLFNLTYHATYRSTKTSVPENVFSTFWTEERMWS